MCDFLKCKGNFPSCIKRLKTSLSGPYNSVAASFSSRGLISSEPEAFVILGFHKTSLTSCALVVIILRWTGVYPYQLLPCHHESRSKFLFSETKSSHCSYYNYRPFQCPYRSRKCAKCLSLDFLVAEWPLLWLSLKFGSYGAIIRNLDVCIFEFFCLSGREFWGVKTK